MDRDDRILAQLAGGTAGSAALAAATDIPLSTVKRALRQLIAADYVFAVERGRYRLTDRGRAVSEPVPARAADGAAAPAIGPWGRAAVTALVVVALGGVALWGRRGAAPATAASQPALQDPPWAAAPSPRRGAWGSSRCAW